PQIQRALDELGADPASLQEAHRQAHCLKGGAALVGLDELGQVALLLEDALEEVRAGQLDSNTETASVLQLALAWITTYLDETQRGVPISAGPPSELEQAFRQLASVSGQKDSASSEESEPDPELVAVFAAEAEDHLRGMATRLTGLLQRPDDRELLQEVRRS